jgi:hypothetical protein
MSETGYGLGAILTSWTAYALIVSALAGFTLQLSELKTVFLAPAMAARIEFHTGASIGNRHDELTAQAGKNGY